MSLAGLIGLLTLLTLFTLLGPLSLPGSIPAAQADDETVRDFAPHGTRVTGLGTPSGAPVIGPGLYRDIIGPVGDPTGVKYYHVQHTPGSGMFFSTTARPPKYADRDDDDGISISVRTQSWDECASWPQLRDADYGMRGLSITDVAIGVQDDDGDDDPCKDEGQLVVEVRRGDPNHETPDATGALDFELQIIEEPAVKTVAGLPAPDETDPIEDESVPPRSPTQPVPTSPGTAAGFSTAATLQPGTARDTVRPGEVRFYRVRADWGQAIAVSARLQPDSALVDEIDEDDGLEGRMRVYSPVRSEIVASDVETFYPSEPLTLSAKLPAVNYRNRETDNWQTSMAGYYYVSLELERDEGQFAVPVEISVAVSGKLARAPEYVGLATPNPVASPPPGESGKKIAAFDNPISIGIASAGGVLVLIGVVLGALFLRRSA